MSGLSQVIKNREILVIIVSYKTIKKKRTNNQWPIKLSVGLYGVKHSTLWLYVAINIIPNLYYFVVLANAVVNCKMLSISTMICLKKDFH